MTLGDIATKARDLVNADTNSYPNTNLLIDLNIWFQKVADSILDSQDDSDFDDINNSTYPQYTFSLVDLQRDYPINSTLNILNIKRLDLTYDAVTWYRAKVMDDSMVKQGLPPVSGYPAMDATVDSRFTKTNPYYDYKYQSLWLYPRAQTGDALAGAKGVAEFSRSVTAFTSGDLSTGTLIPGFDLPFHPILAYGAASEFAKKRALPQLPAILSDLADYEQRLRKHYGSKDKDMKITLIPYDTPEDYYNR